MFSGNWSGAREAVKGIFSSIWEGVKSVFSTTLTALKSALDAFKYLFETIWQAIQILIGAALTAIQTKITSIWNAIVAFITPILNTLQTTFSTVLLYLKIIQRNNWMEHIGYLEIPGMVPGSQAFKVTSEEDIFELYSKGPINIFLEIENKGYISWDSITSTRNPQRSAEQMRIINRNIRKLNNRADDYKGFMFETDKAGLLMGMVEFENSKQEALRIDILKDIGRHPGE